MALHVVVRRPWGREIGTSGQTVWATFVADGAERTPEPRQRPICDDDDLRVNDFRLAVRHEFDAFDPTPVEDRRCRGVGPHNDALLLGEAGHLEIQVGAADDGAPFGVDRMIGPIEFDHQLARVGPEPANPMELRNIEIEPHLLKLMDRARSETVPTRLLAGKLLLLDQQHRPPGAGEPVSGGRATRPAAYYEDVDVRHGGGG